MEVNSQDSSGNTSLTKPRTKIQVSASLFDYLEKESNKRFSDQSSQSSLEEIERQKTPSGNFTTVSVQDIRKFYSPVKNSSDTGSEVVNSQRRRAKSRSRKPFNRNKSVRNEVVSKLKGKAKRLAKSRTMGDASKGVNALNASVDSNQNSSDHDQGSAVSDKQVNSSSSENANIRRRHSIEDVSYDFFVTSRKTLKPVSTEDLRRRGWIKEDQPGQSEESEVESDDKSLASGALSNANSDEEMMDEVETNTSEPAVMDLKSVAEMFSQIKGDMASLKKDMEEIKVKQAAPIEVSQQIIEKCAKDIMTDVKVKMDEQNRKLKAELDQVTFKNQTLTGVVDRMAAEMSELRGRLENLELSNTRKMISISGLDTRDQKDDMINDVQEFIETELGIITTAEECYKIGNAVPRLIVVSFQTLQEKRDVLRFKSRLNKSNDSSVRKIFINDYNPITVQERKRREKQIIAENSQSQEPVEMKYTKYGLTIQGEAYKQRVQPPTPRELVELTPQDMTKMFEVDLKTGNTLVQDKSIFQAFTAEVKTYGQVRELYKRVKLVQPTACHIICIFWLQGKQHYYTRDFCDDGEPGASKSILDLMVKNNLEDRVVFVSRKYGGIKMGSERFNCYLKAARQVLEATLNRTLDAGEERGGAARMVDKPQNPVKRPASSPPGQNSEGAAAQPNKRVNFDNSRNSYNPRYRGRGLRHYKNSYTRDAGRYSYYRRNDQGPITGYRDDNSWSYDSYRDWANPDDGQYYHRRGQNENRY